MNTDRESIERHRRVFDIARSAAKGGKAASGWMRSLSLALVLCSTAAQAAITVNKNFSPASMTVTGTATITITLGNTGASAATGTAFTDALPTGLVVASPSNVGTTCGGTATATSGSGTVALSGGTVPASGGTCTVTVDVTAAATGNYTNTIPVGGVTSSQGSNGSAASATLAVITKQPITGSVAVTWPPGNGGNLKGNGAAATMTFTLNDPNTIALTNVSLTFTLPQPPVAFATPANQSTTCGGTLTLNTGAGTGTLSGGSIPANGNCKFMFDIFASQPNNYYYASPSVTIAANNITDDQTITNSNPVNGGIGVQTGASMSKSFTPNQVVNGGTSTLKLTFNNYNQSVLSPINFTDTFPSGMTVAPTPNAATTCGGTITATPGSGSLQLAGGSLPAVAATATAAVNCTLNVDVVGMNASTTTAINLTNTIPAGNFAGVNYPATNATLTVLPNQPLYGSNKSISNQYYAGVLLARSGSNHTLTITLDNTTLSPITITSVTDSLTTMAAGIVVASSPAPSTTCAGGVVNAPAGGTTVSMTGGTIPASNGTTPGTCTITATIYFPIGLTVPANVTNTIPAGNIVTSAGNNTTPLTYGVSIITPFAIGKSFSPAAVNPGGTSTLTINLVRQVAAGETGVDSLTNLSDTDTLPAGMVIATPSGLSTTCTGATVTAPASGSTINFSGVNLTPNQGCSISLNVVVPLSTPTGNLVNKIAASSVTSDQGVTNSTNTCCAGGFYDGSASATLQVANANVTINKSFTPPNVAVGATSQLSIQFVNTNAGAINVTQGALTDTLPMGMLIANPPSASFSGSGCAGTATATPGGSSVALSNATINAGSTCTLKVNVVANAAGNLINTLPAGTLTSIQNVSNTMPTTATLAVSGTADLNISKTDGKTTVATGTTDTYTIVVGNAGPNNVIGASVSDTPPSGVTFGSWTCVASAGAMCGSPSGSGAINDTVNVNVGATATYTVQAQLPFNYSGGSLANSASVTQPALVTDPNTANNTATDTDTVVPGIVLALTKTDGSAIYTPGGTAMYTITVANTGLANATQVTVNDPLPSGVTLNGSVTCTPAGTATCGTVSGGGGQGSFGATGASLPSGAGNTLTFTVPVAFASNLTTDPLTNTVSATDAPSGATGSASDSDTRSASADLSIVKSGPAAVVPGGAIHYTLTVANGGPSDANGATFNDAVPAAISGITTSCGSASGGAACPASVGVAGNTVSGTVPTLPVGGSVVISIDGTEAAANANPLVNTATVAAPSGVTDPSNGNNSSTVTTAIKPVVSITKTADTNTLVPGGTVHYTITVTNTGPVAANGTLVTDPVVAGIANQTWTCAPSGGATCAASGSGAINDTLTTFPAGAAVVYTVTATIAAAPPTTVTNTASATPPNGVCSPTDTAAPCTATASLPPVPQVGISKSADTMTVIPGATIHYTITVSNTGVLAANGTPVSDPVPAGIASQTWTCAASGGATCTASGSGAISDTLTTFPASSFVTYTVTAIVNATPPAAISNTATANPGGGALCTPGNTAPPCTATATVSSNPQVSITKSADTNTLVPGGTVHYTITVTNTGPVPADGTSVSDPTPAGIASQTWTCAANAGASCTASGSGAISDTIVTFPAGSFVTYTVTATIAANPPATISNTASATPPAGSICTPGNSAPPCTSTVSGTSVAQIGITKSADVTSVGPGSTVHYTITVNNTGAAAADDTTVSDAVPAGIASQTWTCAPSGGATCTASGSGAISDTLTTFPTGSFVTYTVTATATANPPAMVSNTASATPPGGDVCTPGNTAAPCSSTVNLSALPLIGISKTADVGSVIAGGTIHYTIMVSNSGMAAADGTTVSDPVPTGIVSQTWACAGSGGATCAASGSGAISDTIVAFPAGAAATYTVTAIVSAAPPGTIINTASATPPSGGLCAPGNTPPPCTAMVTTPTVSVTGQLSISKTENSATLTPGGTVVYTVTVSNTGTVAVSNVTLSDPLPSGITAFGWTCSGSGGAMCPNASGSGAIAETLASFPVGGTLVYSVTAQVASNPPATVTNTASVTPTGIVACMPSGNSPPCTATAVGTVTAASGSVTPTPSLSVRSMLLLALLLLIMDAGFARRRRQ